MSKKIWIAAAILIFAMGWYVGFSITESEFPKYLMIRREGKPLAYAFSSPEHAKIVTMKDLKDNPGVYLAFPVYADKSNIDRLVS